MAASYHQPWSYSLKVIAVAVAVVDGDVAAGVAGAGIGFVADAAVAADFDVRSSR